MQDSRYILSFIERPSLRWTAHALAGFLQMQAGQKHSSVHPRIALCLAPSIDQFGGIDLGASFTIH